MKYDLNKKPTKFAVRVLKDLSDELYTVLTRKPLEHITVNEICEETNYPRATFYNYFNDIYDLLSYCFYLMKKDVNIEASPDMSGHDKIDLLINKVFDYLDKKRERIAMYLEHNEIDGLFVSKLHAYVTKAILDFIGDNYDEQKAPVRSEIVAEHIANTCQLIFKKSFCNGDQLNKEQAIEAMRYLIGNLY